MYKHYLFSNILQVLSIELVYTKYSSDKQVYYLIFLMLTLQENSTGEEVISHEKPTVPVSTGAGAPPDPNSLFGQLNLPPDLANVLHSFQQGGTLPPNLDQGSAQNILASMMVSRHSNFVP